MSGAIHYFETDECASFSGCIVNSSSSHYMVQQL